MCIRDRMQTLVFTERSWQCPVSWACGVLTHAYYTVDWMAQTVNSIIVWRIILIANDTCLLPSYSPGIETNWLLECHQNEWTLTILQFEYKCHLNYKACSQQVTFTRRYRHRTLHNGTLAVWIIMVWMPSGCAGANVLINHIISVTLPTKSQWK